MLVRRWPILSYIIYNILVSSLFIILFPFYLIYCLVKDKYRATIRQQLGMVKKRLDDNFREENVIWVHAASAGEVLLAHMIINRLKSMPYKIFFTVSTHSGLEMAQKKIPEDVLVSLLPLDLFWIMGRLFRKIKPEITILVEADLWPNFVKYAQKHSQNTVLVNCHFKKEELADHFILPGLLSSTLKRINQICLQTEEDKERIKKYITNTRLRVTGNMKIDRLEEDITCQNTRSFRKELKLSKNKLIFVAGSTHEGEEEILLEVYRNLKKEYNELVLIIAPRHIDRSSEIASMCKKMGYFSVLRSRLKETKKDYEVLILDTMGELRKIYSLADVSFVGGTLVEKGGHNLLEPLTYGCPVFFGPYFDNFKRIGELIMSYGAGNLVETGVELEKNVRNLLSSPEKLKLVEESTNKLLLDHGGALKKHLEIIYDLLGRKAIKGIGNGK